LGFLWQSIARGSELGQARLTATLSHRSFFPFSRLSEFLQEIRFFGIEVGDTLDGRYPFTGDAENHLRYTLHNSVLTVRDVTRQGRVYELYNVFIS